MSDRVDILIAQYEQAVALYKHEDSLTWRKIQQAVYVNGAFATVVGVDLIKGERWLLAMGAAVLSVLFLITVEGSRRYMFARLAAVRDGERILCEAGGCEPIIAAVRPPRGVPATSFAIRVFSWGMILVWTTLAVVWAIT